MKNIIIFENIIFLLQQKQCFSFVYSFLFIGFDSISANPSASPSANPLAMTELYMTTAGVEEHND